MTESDEALERAANENERLLERAIAEREVAEKELDEVRRERERGLQAATAREDALERAHAANIAALHAATDKKHVELERLRHELSEVTRRNAVAASEKELALQEALANAVAEMSSLRRDQATADAAARAGKRPCQICQTQICQTFNYCDWQHKPSSSSRSLGSNKVHRS